MLPATGLLDSYSPPRQMRRVSMRSPPVLRTPPASGRARSRSETDRRSSRLAAASRPDRGCGVQIFRSMLLRRAFGPSSRSRDRPARRKLPHLSCSCRHSTIKAPQRHSSSATRSRVSSGTKRLARNASHDAMGPPGFRPTKGVDRGSAPSIVCTKIICVETI